MAIFIHTSFPSNPLHATAVEKTVNFFILSIHTWKENRHKYLDLNS